MKAPFSPPVFVAILSVMVCSPVAEDADNPNSYITSGRFTDPWDLASMLENFPEDVNEICEIAKRQTVHHNLLPLFGVQKSEWKTMIRIWPHKEPFTGMRNILSALRETCLHNLYYNRSLKHRFLGGRILESVFLTGLLRYKNFPARIRAGHFRDTMANSEHVIEFYFSSPTLRLASAEENPYSYVIHESEAASEIDLTPFKEMARSADCADRRNRLYLIDGRLVFWDREGSCPDNAYSQTLFGDSIDDVLCYFHDSIAGPLRKCHDENYRDLFDTIISTSGETDLWLGPNHRVRLIPLRGR